MEVAVSEGRCGGAKVRVLDCISCCGRHALPCNQGLLSAKRVGSLERVVDRPDGLVANLGVGALQWGRRRLCITAVSRVGNAADGSVEGLG